MHFCFNPFSARTRFNDSMRTHVCICACPQCFVCPRDEIARAYAFMHVDLGYPLKSYYIFNEIAFKHTKIYLKRSCRHKNLRHSFFNNKSFCTHFSG